MEGFFTKKETQSKTRPQGKSTSCFACGLHRSCETPRMEPYGNFKKKILNIGEAPGEVEDNVGKPWQGKAGKLLRRTYDKLGIDLFEDCLNINTVSCRPTDIDDNNRAPSKVEIECCRRFVFRAIEKYKPKVIILFGNSALVSFLGHRWKRNLGTISKWRGWTIPDQDYNAWVCPTFHPSYIERVLSKQEKNPVELLIWEQDLQKAFLKVRESIPEHVEPEIEMIDDLSVLHSITSGEIAFDYETTGLKPHAKGHRIVCCSVADSENHAYSFLMPRTRRERKPFIDLLTNPKIGKIAQNLKYEHSWTLVRLGVEVKNWVWDTMLVSHILDNRSGITSLKFQVYVNFGIVDYEGEVVGAFTETSGAESKDGNAINSIHKLLAGPKGEYELLKYCGLDSVYEMRLANIQRSNVLPF